MALTDFAVRLTSKTVSHSQQATASVIKGSKITYIPKSAVATIINKTSVLLVILCFFFFFFLVRSALTLGANNEGQGQGA